MPRQPTSASVNSSRDRTIFIVASVYLIASCLWKVFTPAHELPLRTEQVLTIVLDVMMVAGLIGLKNRVSGLQGLFWAALVCGLGLLLIRVTSDDAWWSGHLMYSLR
jgi:hypothetical protein